MQNRSIKVRRVFAELRQALGNTISAGELLHLAAALVDATTPTNEFEQSNAHDPTPARDQIPLDQAFADGGWQIMERERKWTAQLNWDDDQPPKVGNSNKRIVGIVA